MSLNVNKKPQITEGRIIDEAIALLGETSSLSGVKMRVLADRLGIKAASLYWHFPNKAALESAMSERLFMQALERVPEADNWQDWLRGVGRAVWDNLIEYPESGLLIMSADLSKDQFSRTINAVKSRLSKFDIDQDRAFQLHSGIQALIIGWATFAHSPYTHQLGTVIDIREAALETVDAMIKGWATRMKSQTVEP